MNVQRELHKALKYDIISFDIFDTLIERDVKKPTDIFFLVGIEYFKEKAKAIDFQRRRITAERIARKNLLSKEVNLDDIYNVLEDYNIETIENLKTLEVNTEIKLCHPRRSIVALFNEIKAHGVSPILISDMYLPKECIVNILTKCGINGYKALFVSNEYGCNKISGKLFDISHKELGIKNATHLHYGDSIKADILGAKKAKIVPRFILRKNCFKLLINKLYESLRNKCR